jgi:hypothetical protein
MAITNFSIFLVSIALSFLPLFFWDIYCAPLDAFSWFVNFDLV